MIFEKNVSSGRIIDISDHIGYEYDSETKSVVLKKGYKYELFYEESGISTFSEKIDTRENNE